MKRNFTIAVILSLLLSSCATYKGADGNTHVADARICSTGVCDFLIIAAITGIGVAVASAH